MDNDKLAFPLSGSEHFDPVIGLTRRELFAAMAMQGMVSNPEWTMTEEGRKAGMSGEEMYARAGITLADALIAELDKENA